MADPAPWLIALLLVSGGAPEPGEDFERGVATVAMVEGVAVRSEERPLILRATESGEIAIFAINEGEARPLADIPGGIEGEAGALCAWRPPDEQIVYAYLADRHGRIAQHLLLFDQQDGGDAPPVEAYPVRSLFATAPVAACAVDPLRGQLYAAVEGEGIRRFDASPPDPGTMGFSLPELVQRLAAIADPGAIGGEPVLSLEEAGGRLGPLAVEQGPGGESYLINFAVRERADGSYAPPVFRLPDMRPVPAEALDRGPPAQ